MNMGLRIRAIIAAIVMAAPFIACDGIMGTQKDEGANYHATPADSLNLILDDSKYPYAGLPRLVIETDELQSIEDRENKIPARLQVYGQNGPEGPIAHLQIRGRGNYTWGLPKKPFNIYLDNKESLLGLAPAKKFALLANYLDRTLIRNAVAYELARKTELEWTPSGKFVEVFLNQVFMGNYYLSEKIGFEKSRLDKSDGAFLLEFDKNFDEKYKFKSALKDLPVNIKKPEQPNDSQFEYISNYIKSVEMSFYSTDTSYHATNFIDIKSFADYLILNELVTNIEISHPKSLYMYKEPNGKLFAGPVWDFDYGTFDPKKKGFLNNFCPVFTGLMAFKKYKQVLKEQWDKEKEAFAGIDAFIDSLADYTRESNERNIKMWPVSYVEAPVGDEFMEFDEAIETMKNVIHTRIDEMEILIDSLANSK